MGRFAHEDARVHVHVNRRAHGGVVLADLIHLPDEHAGLGDDTVALLNAVVRALGDRKGARPVGGVPRGDHGGFGLERRVLFQIPEHRAQTGVLLERVLARAHLLLRLGKLAAERFVFREQLIVAVDVAVNAAHPLHDRAHSALNGDAQGVGRLRHRAGAAVRLRARGKAYEKRRHNDDDRHAHAVLLQISFQGLTPCSPGNVPGASKKIREEKCQIRGASAPYGRPEVPSR